MCEILSEPQRTQRMPSGQRSFSSRMRHFSSVPNCSINFIRFISPLGCAFCLRFAMIGVSAMPKEKEKKEPLDMTTDEMADYLFPKKVHDRLKEVARGKDEPPPSDETGANVNDAP